jgi:hypothetical protein
MLYPPTCISIISTIDFKFFSLYKLDRTVDSNTHVSDRTVDRNTHMSDTTVHSNTPLSDSLFYRIKSLYLVVDYFAVLNYSTVL